jgi:hypothetical protein
LLFSRRTYVVPSLAGSLLALLVACSGSSPNGAIDSNDDGGPPPGQPDGRTPAEAGPEVDGGTDAEAGPTPAVDTATLLAQNIAAIHGMTLDDHVIYARTLPSGERSLEAIAIVGGAVTTIFPTLPADYVVDVKGDAVAIWRFVDATTGIGSLSYWTLKSGLVVNADNASLSHWFWATDDGARIAFLTDTSVDQGALVSASLTIASTGSFVKTEVLAGDERLAFDDKSCGSHVGFAGNTLIAAYCAVGSTDGARLVTVATEVPSPTRRLLVESGLTPFWSAGEQAVDILAISTDHEEGRIVKNDATAATTPLETGFTSAFVMRDGSAAVYHAGTTIRRVSLLGGVGTPSTIANDARAVLDVSTDQSTVLYHSLEGRPVDPQFPDGDRYVDLRSIATSGTAAAPKELVTTESALPLGLSSNGLHAIYFANGPKLKAIGLDGSGERAMSIDFNGLATTPSGSAAVLSRNVRQEGTWTLVDLDLADFTIAGQGGAMATKPIIDRVPSGAFRFGGTTKKRLVYVKLVNGSPTLYSRILP